MGRKSSDSATQATARTEASGSSSSKPPKPTKVSTSASGGTSKPLLTVSKKPPVVESDEEDDKPSRKNLPTKQKKSLVSSVAARRTVDEAGPSISKKAVPSKPKPVRSPLTSTKPAVDSGKKPAVKKQKAAPQPVEADSEESEEEWVGFGEINEESDDEDESENEEEDNSSSEEEFLHGLSSDDDQDSSDEEIELPGIDISKLPTIAKDDKTVKQKLEKAKRQPVRPTPAHPLLLLVLLISRLLRRLWIEA